MSYNIESGGNKQKTLSEETKQKLRDWNKGKKWNREYTKEQREHWKNLRLGKKMSPESIQKMVKSKKENMTDEVKFKLSLGRKGKSSYNAGVFGVFKHSDENKKKISEAMSKEFALISPTGEIFRGKNISEFARKMNIHPKGLSVVLLGQRSEYKGWKKLIE